MYHSAPDIHQPPIFVTRLELARILETLGVTTETLRAAHDDAEIEDQITPEQQALTPARIVLRLMRRARMPQQEPPALRPDKQLIALENLAKADPTFRRHRLFWHALRDAKRGYRLAQRQRQLLDIAWRVLGNKYRPSGLVTRRTRRPESLRLYPFRHNARAATKPTPARAAHANNPKRAVFEPIRNDDWMPKMQPDFSDTDSGDD